MEAYYRRVRYMSTRPNPLFEEWIRDLLEEAVEKKSRLEPMLRQALNSIKKYPLRLQSGADCAILKGFHKKLCAFIDYRISIYDSIISEDLEEERAEGQNVEDIDEQGNIICERTVSSTNTYSNTAENRNAVLAHSHTAPIAQPQVFGAGTPRKSTSSQTRISYRSKRGSSLNNVNRNNSTRAVPQEPVIAPVNFLNVTPSTSGKFPIPKIQIKYKPSPRTGGFAILLTLLEHFNKTPEKGLNKDQLIQLGQKYCDESFSVPKPNTHYTAWSNMPRLIKKGLVKCTRNTKDEYHLTAEGIILAQELMRDAEMHNRPSDNNQIFGSPANSDATTDVVMTPANSIADDVLEFPAGTFDIILLIDKNETSGLSKKDDPTIMQFNKYPGLKHEYRSLKVGDFAWIAQHRVSKVELVLPYIVERKRMDDLAASIKDGRFHEQKFRLHKCGLGTVIYMVESYGKNKNVGLPLQSLKQALANTRVHDDFKILATDSLANTVRLLAVLSNKIANIYKDKSLKGINGAPSDRKLMTFQYFCKVSMKNKALNVKGLFLKQLLQLKGLSVDKALAIANKYPTPRLLVEEYKKHDQSRGEMLLANLKYGDLSRNVGPNVSKAIYDLFCKRSEN